jgi:glycosyltransferase involved in cell wall biosynthesis
VTARYFLPSGYESRPEPARVVDDWTSVWRPELCQRAAIVARRIGTRTLIGVGGATALRLAHLQPEFDVIGIDIASEVVSYRGRGDSVTWVETDLDSARELGYESVAEAVIVCDGLLERLKHPEHLVRMLRSALDQDAAAVLLSSHERPPSDEGPLGPPAEESRVREWTLPELERFLSSEGLHGFSGLIRAGDGADDAQTIVIGIPADEARSREIVREWFDELERWRRLAEKQFRRIDELEQWVREMNAAKDWAEEQRVAWRSRAEQAESQLEQEGPRGGRAPAVEESIEASSSERRASPRITVVTEVETSGADLRRTAASLVAQTFRDWEWVIVAIDDSVTSPVAEPRVRVSHGRSRARAINHALRSKGDVALLEEGAVIPATALEKWLWFLEAHPSCGSVLSSESRGAPRLIRRAAVDDAGSLDAAAEVTLASAGFVPLPDNRPPELWGYRAPAYLQAANEWLPDERSIWNAFDTDAPRLLLIVPWMTSGGSDRFNLDLLDQLGRLGWQFTIATTIDGPHDLYRAYERRATDLFPLAHFLPLPYQPLFLRYLIESRRPDVVLISNSELGYRLTPYLRGVAPDTPILDFCHSEAEHWNKGGYPRFSIEFREFLDLTLTASEHLKRWMVERGGETQRIEVCYANVDTERFRPSAAARDSVRSRLGLPPDEPIVLFAGRISEDKQPRVLADALARLGKRGVRFTAVIAGDGPDRAWLEGELARSLRTTVRMLGSVEAGEVATLMAAADVLFLPSRSEGIALALYESMACGTPVVGARVGGQAELVTEECGALIDRSTPGEEAERYAAALERLLVNPDLRAAMGAAARDRVEERFRLDQLGPRADELIRRAIELHRSDPGPVPTPAAARTSATATIELMRLARLMDSMWPGQLSRGGVRGIRLSVYVLLRGLLRPAYYWGLRHGWSWLPRARDKLLHALAGIST